MLLFPSEGLTGPRDGHRAGCPGAAARAVSGPNRAAILVLLLAAVVSIGGHGEVCDSWKPKMSEFARQKPSRVIREIDEGGLITA